MKLNVEDVVFQDGNLCGKQFELFIYIKGNIVGVFLNNLGCI